MSSSGRSSESSDRDDDSNDEARTGGSETERSDDATGKSEVGVRQVDDATSSDSGGDESIDGTSVSQQDSEGRESVPEQSKPDESAPRSSRSESTGGDSEASQSTSSSDTNGNDRGNGRRQDERSHGTVGESETEGAPDTTRRSLSGSGSSSESNSENGNEDASEQSNHEDGEALSEEDGTIESQESPDIRPTNEDDDGSESHTSRSLVTPPSRAGSKANLRVDSARNIGGNSSCSSDEDRGSGSKCSSKRQRQATAAANVQPNVSDREDRATRTTDPRKRRRQKATRKIQGKSPRRRAHRDRSSTESIDNDKVYRNEEEDTQFAVTGSEDPIGSEAQSAGVDQSNEEAAISYHDGTIGKITGTKSSINAPEEPRIGTDIVEHERRSDKGARQQTRAAGKEDAARRIQRQMRRKIAGGKVACHNSMASDKARSRKRPVGRDNEDQLREERVLGEGAVPSREGAGMQHGRGERDSHHVEGSNDVHEKAALGEDDAARRIQTEARRRRARKRGRGAKETSDVRGKVALGEEEAARRIQREVLRGRAGKKRRDARRSQQRRENDERAVRRDSAARLIQSKVRRVRRKQRRKEDRRLPDAEEDGRDRRKHGDRILLLTTLGIDSGQQPSEWISPGKVAATAAATAAKAAAKAAAASVKAAEAAADAAEAAEAAADAEEERLSPAIFRSPRGHPESRQRHSPARSAFWVTEGDKESPEERCQSSEENSRLRDEDGGSKTAGPRVGIQAGRIGEHRMRRTGQEEFGGVNERREARADGSEEEAMLQKAREQARRHARDRRARAIAKEEESRRELRAVQADLVKAEELRERQAKVERSTLEAKRARVMEDMKRRQQRLQRLQEEDGLLGRRGDPHPRNPGSSASACDSSTLGGENARPTRGDGDDCDSRESSVRGAAALALPRLARGTDEAGARRKPRHVSAFRERILEERRARKEIETLKRKELDEKLGRQADYAAKIRAQAKRALAAEQRRAQEDADRSARAPRNGQSVDRTPVAIKRPKREGEWGVFSYAPDRPAARVGKNARGGAEGDRPGGQPGPDGTRVPRRVQERLNSSELAERMRKERAKATEASRARAGAGTAAAVTGADDGGRVNGNPLRSQPGEAGRRARGAESSGGEQDGWSGRHAGPETGRHHRPAPPVRQRRTGGLPNDGHDHQSGSAGFARSRIGVARPGVGAGPPDGQQRPLADENIHRMYEERLAALERRLAGGGDGSRSRVPSAHSGGSDNRSLRAQEERSAAPRARQPRPPLHGGEERGIENNSLGYRELKAASDDDDGGDRFRSSDASGVVSSGGSARSREMAMERLSTMYMGPIASKMAELRAGNDA